MVAQTSLLAYGQVTGDKVKLGKKQQIVFDAVRTLGRASNEQIADYLGWAINQVTGRTNELKYKGFIGDEGYTSTKLGNKCRAYSIRDPFAPKYEQDC